VVRHIVFGDRERAARLHLVVGAQVDDGANPELDHAPRIVGCESVETVSPKEPPPTGLATINRWIPTEVTKIVHRKQRHDAPVVIEERRDFETRHRLYGTEHDRHATDNVVNAR